MKKVLSLLLALFMVLSLCVTAFAADDATTTAPLSTATHTYKAYQIFSGTQTTDADDSDLGNVVWGSGIDSTNFLAALKNSTDFGTTNPFADCTTAAAVAAAMKDWTDSSENAEAFAKLAENYIYGDGATVVNGQTELDAGYYLVVDTTETVGEGDAKNLALLQLTKKGTFEIKAKNEVPKVEKKVRTDLTCTKLDANSDDYDATHVHTKDCYTWADANNAAIGDTVNFKIETQIPESAAEYDVYFFIINDTLSAGLTYADSLVVTIDGTTATSGTDYYVKEDGQNIQVGIANAIANAGKAIVVTYSATLNENAVVGNAGNNNKVVIDYSNDPNIDIDKDKNPNDDSKPGFPNPAYEEYAPNGVTPADYTITYTTKLNVYKVDENNERLSGAEFTLEGTTLKKVLVCTETFTAYTDADSANADKYVYYKLKDGTYTTEAPVTADYMTEAAAGATAGYVADSLYTEDDKIEINGIVYRAYDSTTDSGATVYTLVKANKDTYDSTTTKYKCEWVSTTETASGDTLSVVASVDENGEVSFAGLSAGTYTLKETGIPAGYNPIDDIEFTLDWAAPATVTAGNETCTWSEESDDVSYNTTNNLFEITVQNVKGTTLPETGGIGTTIFYVIGGVLVLGAAVMLITKKRMDV